MLPGNLLDHSTQGVECQHSESIFRGIDALMKKNEKELRDRLGKALREARFVRQLTQNQLAELVETDPETISRFERGATLPSLTRLLDLAEALDVTLASLLGGASPRVQDEWQMLQQSVLGLSARDRELAASVLKAIVALRITS
jgi:transcriptional regulator with XRE-family HTH domain